MHKSTVQVKLQVSIQLPIAARKVLRVTLIKGAELLSSGPNLTTKQILFYNPLRPKERSHSGLQIKSRVEALGQVLVKILPWEHSRFARVVQSLCIKSEGRRVISQKSEGSSVICRNIVDFSH